jgi:hypothetical protein
VGKSNGWRPVQPSLLTDLEREDISKPKITCSVNWLPLKSRVLGQIVGGSSSLSKILQFKSKKACRELLEDACKSQV